MQASASKIRDIFIIERPSDDTACRQRALTSGLMVERSFSFRLWTGRQLIIRALFALLESDGFEKPEN